MSAMIIDLFAGYRDANGVNKLYARIACDTVSDLPAPAAFPEGELVMGSIAEIIDDGSEYKMDSSGTWHKQPAGSGGGDSYTKSETDDLIAGRIPYQYGEEIVAASAGDADLNNFTDTGTYHSTAASAANTDNTPKAPNGAITGYRLDVVQISATLVQQILRPNGSECYIFIRNRSGSRWTPWYNINEQGLAQGIAPNSDLNDLTAVGTFYCGATTAGTLTNNPAGAAAIKVNVEYLNGTNRLIQTLTPATNGTFTFYKRQYTSSGFQSWYKFEGVQV